MPWKAPGLIVLILSHNNGLYSGYAAEMMDLPKAVLPTLDVSNLDVTKRPYKVQGIQVIWD